MTISWNSPYDLDKGGNKKTLPHCLGTDDNIHLIASVNCRAAKHVFEKVPGHTWTNGPQGAVTTFTLRDPENRNRCVTWLADGPRLLDNCGSPSLFMLQTAPRQTTTNDTVGKESGHKILRVSNTGAAEGDWQAPCMTHQLDGKHSPVLARYDFNSDGYPTCAVVDAATVRTVDIPEPKPASVTFSKSATPSNPKPGDKVSYTLTAKNSSPDTDATDVSFQDDLTGILDDASAPADTKASAGTVTGPDGSNKLTWKGTLPKNGGTATITYSVTVKNPDTGDRTLSNVVVSDAPGSNCKTGSTDAACKTNTLVEKEPLKHLEVTKQRTPNRFKAGTVITFTVTARNPNAERIENARIVDDLSRLQQVADLQANSLASSTGSAPTVTGSKLTWAGPIDAGQTATIKYSFTYRAGSKGSPDNGVVTIEP
ncbi:DUF7927 domain-containing protein [Streptomyces sp. NBC_01304]|uniref:DUF7927 domain-containing protein n=1 Tax=Streptomyces sp. NBC_01304 TaxID=2903818 RepID=UPI002E1411A5|nr:DUF11 domain-containing protein [Streptomyces sp. NBC_01304]